MTAKIESHPKENGLNHLQLFVQGEYLKEAKQGVNSLLDTFEEVLNEETKNAKNTEETVDSLKERFKKIDNDCWNRIRTHYISKNDEEELPPSSMEQVVIRLTEKLDRIKHGIELKIQGVLYKEDEYKTEIRNLKQALGDERHNIVELKWQRQKEVEETSGSHLSKDLLIQQLEEKRELIAELQRSSTVQLWEKEKEKVLAKAKQREEEMKREYEELKQTYDDLRDRTTNRIRDLEERVKIGKMKSLNPKSPRTEWETENEKLKRQLYMKEMDANKAEQEILKQQKLYAGCVKGIKRDFKVISERQDSGKIATDDINKMAAILEAIFAGACHGNLERMKADLPLYYYVVDDEIKGHSTRKLSKVMLHAPTKLELISESTDEESGNSSTKTRRASRIWSDKEITAGSRNPSMSNLNSPTETKSLEPPSVTVTNGSNAELRVDDNDDRPKSAISNMSAEVQHPDLVDEDGILDLEMTKKCFPHMTPEEIKEHFSQFREYDANDDYTLDFVEMLQAIRGTVGDYFKPRAIKEAVAEIDVDHSDAVDFYEYLRISALLLKKAGKSEIFRSGLVKDASNSMSRVCSIQ